MNHCDSQAKPIAADCGEAQPAASMEGLVCTLFEGDYHLGLAALVNSLVRSGYQGPIVAGYRGALPPWLGQLKRVGNNGTYEVAPGVRLEFVPQDTAVHFTNLKARFMQRLVCERSGSQYIWYFDPDIVVNWPWSFYMHWTKNGIALCEDVNGSLPADHPLRHRWSELVAGAGLKGPRPLSRYFNAGAVGLPASCAAFLETWQVAAQVSEAYGIDLREFGGTGDRTHPFHMRDQDALNIAVMYSKLPLTTLGASGMGFIPGGAAMFHAIGTPKPWRKRMVLSALKGVPPSPSDKAFLASVNGPIRVYSQFAALKKRASCAAGALIGRFYRRR